MQDLSGPGQDMSGEGVGLSGSQGSLTSDPFGLGHHRVAGGVVGCLQAGGGVQVKDGDSGLLDSGHGPVGIRHVAQ